MHFFKRTPSLPLLHYAPGLRSIFLLRSFVHEDDSLPRPRVSCFDSVAVPPRSGIGGEATHLTDTPQGVDDFEWSPDSTRLVLILRDPKPEDLEAAKDKDKDKPAAAPKPKTPPPFVIDRLQFKRDTVGYLDRRRTHLYIFDVASKKTTQVTSGDFDDSEPAWSPDGLSLAFSSNRSTPDPDRTYNSDIWVVAASNTDKGAHLTQITSNPGPDRSPAWSPDGKWIAFISQIDM